MMPFIATFITLPYSVFSYDTFVRLTSFERQLLRHLRNAYRLIIFLQANRENDMQFPCFFLRLTFI